MFAGQRGRHVSRELSTGHLSRAGMAALFPTGEDSSDEELNTPKPDCGGNIALGAVSLADQFPEGSGAKENNSSRGRNDHDKDDETESGALLAVPSGLAKFIKNSRRRSPLQDDKPLPAHLIKSGAGRATGALSPGERDHRSQASAASYPGGGRGGGDSTANDVTQDDHGGRRPIGKSSRRELLETLSPFHTPGTGGLHSEQSAGHRWGARPAGKREDGEAARSMRVSSGSGVGLQQSLMDEVERRKNQCPADWMTVSDTMGMPFLWFTTLLQLCAGITSLLYLSSAHDDQLSWKTGCWGEWSALVGTEGIDWVLFETQVGWRLYGKAPRFGWLADVDSNTAVVGYLSGGMHAVVLSFSCGFLLFSLSALLLSYYHVGSPAKGRGSAVVSDCGVDERSGHDDECPGKTFTDDSQAPDPNSFWESTHRLMLGRSCHRWMTSMGIIMVFAGLWCLVVGCLVFYLTVTTDFTRGLEAVVSAWGESVTCAKAETRPLYGFFANAVAVFLLLGGGTLCLIKSLRAESELSEAVDLWKHERAEIAEMQARTNMIRKKEAYSQATAAAAAAALNSGRTCTTKHSRDISTGADSDDTSRWSYSTDSTDLPRPPASPRGGGSSPGSRGSPVPGGVSSPGLLPRLSPAFSLGHRKQETTNKTATEVSSSESGGKSKGKSSTHKRAVSHLPFELGPPQSPTAIDVDPLEYAVCRGRAYSSATTGQEAEYIKPGLLSEASGRAGTRLDPGISPKGRGKQSMGIIPEERDEDEDVGGGDGGHDPLPPPAGWDERSTPAGEKFWVNVITKNVSWERPS